MLAPGLAASLRSAVQSRAGAACLQLAAASRTSLSRPLIGSALPTRRPLSTAHPLLARLVPPTRRRESQPLVQPQRADSLPSQEADAAFLYSDLPPPPKNAQQPSIPRALLFLFGFSAISSTSAAYYSLRDTERIACEQRSRRDVFANISSFFSGAGEDARGQDVWGPGATEKRLAVAKKHETATRLGLRMDWLVGWCNQLHLPAGLTEFVGRSYLIVSEKYINLSPSKEVVLPIVVANGAVFALWTVASARRGGMWRWMNHNFLHRPSSNRMRTMLTSVFSHQTFLHFAFNNYALWSFGGSALIVAAHQTASYRSGANVPEASPTPHFLAFFATAGVFAATVSHIVAAIRFKRISAAHGLDVARAALGRQGSLGASGAVYAAVVMSACAFPDAQLGIIFLPFFTFPIGAGVAGLVAADVAGVLFRWRMFDHWAHLGGAAFGWLYWWYGAEAWERLKRLLVERLRMGARGAVEQR